MIAFPARPAIWVAVWVSFATPLWAMDAAHELHESDGVRASVVDACDPVPVIRVTLSGDLDPKYYSSAEAFAAKVDPQAPAILAKAGGWLRDAAPESCEAAARLVLVGLVEALPVYLRSARLADDWRLDAGVEDLGGAAEDVALCQAYRDDARPRLEKAVTRMFTISLAHTTGQWNAMKALATLVKMQARTVADLLEWGRAGACDGDFTVQRLAILLDIERRVLLEESVPHILEKLAAQTTIEGVDGVMTKYYRNRDHPLVVDAADMIRTTVSGVSGARPVVHGGVAVPITESLDAAWLAALDRVSGALD